MEKIFDNYKGVIIFYMVIAILTLLFVNYTHRQPSLISITNEQSVKAYA